MNPLLLAALILMLGWTWLFRRFGGPPEVARRACGQLLELLLYGDSPRVLGRVLVDLGGSSLRLARQFIWPSLASLLLLALVVAPLRHYVCWRPFRVGERFLVSQSMGPTLEHDAALRLDSEVLVAPHDLYYWRVIASEPGAHFVRFNDHSGDDARIWVGTSWSYLNPRQGRYSIFYPEREIWLGGHLISWPLGLACACLFWFSLGLAIRLLMQL